MIKLFNKFRRLLFRENVKKEELKLEKSLSKNIALFKKVFEDDESIIFREFESKGENEIKCCIIFADEMVNKEIINENIIKPIIECKVDESIFEFGLLDYLMNKVIISGEVKRVKDIDELIGSILYGATILLVNDLEEVLVIDTKGWEVRSVSEPLSESVVRGPREGFTESIKINLSLIRRRVRSNKLKFQFKEIGLRTKTRVCICYIEDLANEKIVKEVFARLEKIEIDGVLETGYIEELIRDSPFSPFNTIGYTERPDVVAAKLLEGRIAILCDGTPFVSTLPYLFIEYFQASEDYYNNYIFATINRSIRIIGFFLSTSVPAIYVALTTYHQEMIPTPLLLSISAAREGVPLPTVIEAMIMLFTFEIIREAGVRLPAAIGQAVSIVGALVLGQAAVAARLISAPMVIVTALTGISSFLTPQMIETLILIRFILLALSSFLGLYGYIFGIIGIFIHLMSLRSFGVPYMLNVSPINKQDVKDTAIRAPWWYMYYRPKLISDRNSVRKADANRRGRR
ncbi:spore germination protein [Caloranaerobacter azorensis]|uniref:spore germination protein n=1 Tax=Caloranaerobacter azorensis TaxID=116090 RepID=UPI002022BBF4|nr:spore germination protein [Caloranaerobacter azorensis]